MMLIGMFDSPFVRRVAISMKMLGIEFEHADWSVGRDFSRIREFNPLGRVPTLVLDDRTSLAESSAILDYIDELAGAQRALLPASGAARRESLQLMALAIGAADKGREVIYESAFRPPEKRHEPWLQRVTGQMHGALAELERAVQRRGSNRWLVADRTLQPDITLGCTLTFLCESVGLGERGAAYVGLHAFRQRCEELPEFKETKAPWFAPSMTAG